MKLRVVELLLVTTLPALFLASGGVPSWSTTLATLIGGTLAAGASNAFNQVIERESDAKMQRCMALLFTNLFLDATTFLGFGN